METLSCTRSYAKKDLEKIRLAKKDIANKSNLLTKTIGNILKRALEKLNELENNLIGILNEKINKTSNIENREIFLQGTNIDKLKKQIEALDIKVSFKDREEEKNRKKKERIEEDKRKKEEKRKTKEENKKECLIKFEFMPLRKKIEYFHPILSSYSSLWSDINNCFRVIREIVISKDEKFLFAYWFSNAKYSYLDLFDLATKKCLNNWCTSKRSNSSDSYKVKDLEKWICEYPECLLKTWNFRSLFN